MIRLYLRFIFKPKGPIERRSAGPVHNARGTPPTRRAIGFEGELIAYLETNFTSTLSAIAEKGELTDEIISDLEQAVDEFKKAFAS